VKFQKDTLLMPASGSVMSAKLQWTSALLPDLDPSEQRRSLNVTVHDGDVTSSRSAGAMRAAANGTLRALIAENHERVVLTGDWIGIFGNDPFPAERTAHAIPNPATTTMTTQMAHACFDISRWTPRRWVTVSFTGQH
jgi:hypothetical protein